MISDRFLGSFLFGFFLGSLPLGRILGWLTYAFLVFFCLYRGSTLVSVLLALFEYRYLRRRFRP